MANRLAQETSPYLRQHADNPVDWYPWGDEAFEVAHREDKPVLLSIGYSSCHWCHVMAHESFEDPDTAAVMNRYFVNIKVDREERPDVDAVYMDAVQAMTGHGGWPMTVVLDHERRPFFAGTYFPKASRGNMVGFVPLLERIHEVWSTERDKLLADAEKVATVVRRSEDLAAGSEIAPADSLEQAAQALQAQFDPQWGGFGSAPKFPQAMALDALLRHHVHTGEQTSLDMVTTSLDAMASGGIYDHLGGGFSRYSVDAHWLVPHFEKMLYDQATLTRAYLHAWQVTGEPRFQQVVQETIGYVLRDLCHPQGGFFSAEDADSEGEEGKFYTWTVDEIRSVLGADAAAAIEWYGVTEAGNFEGANILHRPDRGQLIRPEPVESARQRLLNHRATRIRPGLDDKVLTEWNALFLSVLAEAGAAMGRDDWIEAARANGQFLLDELRRPDGRWLRSWQEDGGARHLAYAADHAAVVDALIRLAEATGERGWIESACETADAMLELFWAEEGGLYTTGTDAERLLARQKDVLDNASPAANSLAALAMLRLGALTGSSQYSDRATAILALVGPAVARHPAAFGYMLAAVDLFHRGTTEIVVAGEVDGAVAEVQRRFLPNGVLAWGEPFESPLWEGRQEGHAYVCRNFTCQAPVTSSVDLAAQLDAA